MKVKAPTTPSGPSAGGPARGVATSDAGPVGRAVAGLATVDRAMASILRAVAEAGPVDGLPAARLISLAAGATGWDIRYLRRTTDTLTAMPGVWTAFDQGEISWSQVRGITTAAKGLSVADRHTLDGQLSGAIADNATAEPDRIVEVAGDLAARLDEAAQERRDTQSAKGIGLRLIPDLFGGSTIHGQLDDQLTALVSNAIHSAADAPVAYDHQPTDADGKPIPRSWLAPTRRAAQLAEALGRVCAQWLAGRTGPIDSTTTLDATAIALTLTRPTVGGPSATTVTAGTRPQTGTLTTAIWTTTAPTSPGCPGPIQQTVRPPIRMATTVPTRL